MFLIHGLRDFSVGTDTMYYVNVYKGFQSSEYNAYLFTHYEPGFQALYNILDFFHADSQILIAIISAVIMLGFAKFIYDYSIDVGFSTFIFATALMPNSMNIIRQYMALAIAIQSYGYILQKKYIKASIIILVASLFHATSLLLFIPVALYIFKNWKLSITVLLTSSIGFAFLGNQIVRYFLVLFGRSFYTSEAFISNRFFRMTTLLTVFYATLLLYYFINNMVEESNKQQLRLLTSIAVVNLDFGVLYLWFEFMSRIIELFNTFLLLSFPILVSYAKVRYRKVLKLLLQCLLIFLMVMTIYNSGSGVEEYKFFFSA